MFDDGTNTVTFQTAVPEPSTLALLAGGAIAAAGGALRRQRARQVAAENCQMRLPRISPVVWLGACAR